MKDVGSPKVLLEVKHHIDPHNYTPFDVTLSAKAKLDDIREGFKRGLNNEPFDRVLIVCNMRLTEHARRYADCIGIDHINRLGLYRDATNRRLR